jgi:spoIIIJ-associated protein
MPAADDETGDAAAMGAGDEDQATELAAYEVGEAGEAGDQADERRRGRRGGRGRNGRERSAAAPRERDRDRPAREPAPFVPAKPLAELSEDERTVLEDAKTVLEELLRLMGINGSVEIAMGHEASKLNVVGDGLGVLIGRRGEKLASLQHIVNLMVARGEAQHHRIMVDVENYRGRREDQLRDVADRAAKRVIQTGKIIQLEAMPAVERRIVHMALVENPRIRTQSVGIEPNRRIVILPASQVEPR